MKNKIKNENFVVIQGWMLNELKLKGNDLIVYAIIYGFSQSDNKCYNGSLQYLADWCNSSVNGIQKNLKNLVSKGLINKKEIYIKKVKFCEYTTKFDTIQLSCMGIYNNVNGGIQQSCNNNIDNNINNNIEKENKKEKMANSKKYEIKQYQQWYNSYISSEQSLFSLYQELHIDVRCIKELLFVFTYKLNSNKESNAFQYIEHFKNWLNTDGGKKAINDIKKV